MAEPETVEVRDLVVHRGGKQVLHGVSLAIEVGSVTALVGANGAGKSSLVGAISGVLPVTSGRVALAGRRLNGLSSDARLAVGRFSFEAAAEGPPARTGGHTPTRGSSLLPFRAARNR